MLMTSQVPVFKKAIYEYFWLKLNSTSSEMLNKMVRNHNKTHVDKNKEGVFFSVEIIEHTVTDLSQVEHKIYSQNWE